MDQVETELQRRAEETPGITKLHADLQGKSKVSFVICNKRVSGDSQYCCVWNQSSDSSCQNLMEQGLTFSNSPLFLKRQLAMCISGPLEIQKEICFHWLLNVRVSGFVSSCDIFLFMAFRQAEIFNKNCLTLPEISHWPSLVAIKK